MKHSLLFFFCLPLSCEETITIFPPQEVQNNQSTFDRCTMPHLVQEDVSSDTSSTETTPCFPEDAYSLENFFLEENEALLDNFFFDDFEEEKDDYIEKRVHCCQNNAIKKKHRRFFPLKN